MTTRTLIKEFPTQFFEGGIRALLSLLLLALLGAIGIGALQTFLDLWHGGTEMLTTGNLHHACKPVLIDALSILAMVEVFRTAMAYFTEGRVKVTYIIDTVLVAVLTEVLAFWYRDMEPTRLAMVIILVLSLIFARILAIQFSPDRVQAAEGL